MSVEGTDPCEAEVVHDHMSWWYPLAAAGSPTSASTRSSTRPLRTSSSRAATTIGPGGPIVGVRRQPRVPTRPGPVDTASRKRRRQRCRPGPLAVPAHCCVQTRDLLSEVGRAEYLHHRPESLGNDSPRSAVDRGEHASKVRLSSPRPAWDPSLGDTPSGRDRTSLCRPVYLASPRIARSGRRSLLNSRATSLGTER
jgi:hypothetical protein